MPRLEDLPEKTRKQVVAAMAKGGQAKVAAPRSRKEAPSSDTVLRCTCGFEHPSPKTMDEHCDQAGHHRYWLILDA